MNGWAGAIDDIRHNREIQYIQRRHYDELEKMRFQRDTHEANADALREDKRRVYSQLLETQVALAEAKAIVNAMQKALAKLGHPLARPHEIDRVRVAAGLAAVEKIEADLVAHVEYLAST